MHEHPICCSKHMPQRRLGSRNSFIRLPKNWLALLELLGKESAHPHLGGTFCSTSQVLATPSPMEQSVEAKSEAADVCGCYRTLSQALSLITLFLLYRAG